jgi:hypothetical protein
VFFLVFSRFFWFFLKILVFFGFFTAERILAAKRNKIFNHGLRGWHGFFPALWREAFFILPVFPFAKSYSRKGTPNGGRDTRQRRASAGRLFLNRPEKRLLAPFYFCS